MKLTNAPARTRRLSEAEARSILGSSNVFGLSEVQNRFDVKLGKIPLVPFSAKELDRAKGLNHRLYLQVGPKNVIGNLAITPQSLFDQINKTKDGYPMR